MRTLACLGVLGYGVAACNPSAIFIQPTGKECTDDDGGEPCPDGWVCLSGICYSTDAGLPTSGTTGTTSGTSLGTTASGTSGSTAATTGAATSSGTGTGTTATTSSSGTTAGATTASSSGTTSGASQCTILSQTFDAGAVNPTNACQLCDLSSPTAWSNAQDGTACDAGGNFCVSGACLEGCYFNDAFEPDGGLNPVNPCQACNAAALPTGWSSLPDLTLCGSNGLYSSLCAGGVCTDTCVLDAGVDAGCGCASGVETCNGTTVDTCVDDLNCGACGNTCAMLLGCFGGGPCGTPAALDISVTDAAALLGPDGRLYVIGGITSTTSYTAAVQVYDPRANSWGTAPSMITARGQFGAAVDSAGNFYALGGFSSFSGTSAVPTAASEILRVGASSWSSLNAAPGAFSSTQIAKGTNGLFYLPGGYVDGPASVTQTYDPATDTWGTGPSLKISTAYCGAAAGADGTLYSFGGTNSLSSPVSPAVSAESLSRLDGGWGVIPDMPTPRCDVGTAVDATGLIYVIGGNNCTYSAGAFMQYPNIDVFIPDAGQWANPASPLGLLNTVQGPACVTAVDGRVFCFGGFDGTKARPYVQVYNPATQNIVP